MYVKYVKINEMMKIIKNLEEMDEFAKSIANKISGRPTSGKAIVLGLFGDLGSGKTTFSKSFVGAFGVEQTVTSPTFVIEKIYKLPLDKKFKHIIHIDAYRLSNGKELIELGWNEIFENPENIILIEWPEKVADILPEDIEKIHFEFIDEDKREIKYD